MLERYALLGKPVHHSVSPLIHHLLAMELGDVLSYARIAVDTEDLEGTLTELHQKGYQGINITVPHKETVIPYLGAVDDMARRMGAVNTLCFRDKDYEGHNTDWLGILQAFRMASQNMQDLPVIVLGAGGAARAAVMAAIQGGASAIYIANRTLDKCMQLREAFLPVFDKIFVLSLADAGEKENILPQKGLIAIQTTSVGMYPKVDEVLLSSDYFFERLSYVYDIVYNPMETQFLKLAKQKDIPCDNGLGMLVYQAVAAYEYWHHKSVPEEVARCVYDKVRRYMNRTSTMDSASATDGTSPMNHTIVLEGFMGSGKTTTAKILAKRLSLPMIDTDQWIENRLGMTVSAIFEEYGEDFFREMETVALMILLLEGQVGILSLGGRVPIPEENRELLKFFGNVIYLRATSDTICKRLVQDGSRPLLQGDDRESKVAQLLAQREQYYQMAADRVIDVDDKSMEEVARIIEEAIR